MDYPALRWKKRGAYTLRVLFALKPMQTINYDVCRMRRYRRNIFQWEENDIESMKMATGDY